MTREHAAMRVSMLLLLALAIPLGSGAQRTALAQVPGPTMLHGVTFGGADKKTLFAIVFYGNWGTASARNRVIAIPTVAQGYLGRAK